MNIDFQGISEIEAILKDLYAQLGRFHEAAGQGLGSSFNAGAGRVKLSGRFQKHALRTLIEERIAYYKRKLEAMKIAQAMPELAMAA